MNSIYRLFTGEYIDLSEIVSIENLTKEEHCFRFTIFFQLMSLPCLYVIHFINDEYYSDNGGHTYTNLYKNLYRYDTLEQYAKDTINNEVLEMYNKEYEEALINYNEFIQHWKMFKGDN